MRDATLSQRADLWRAFWRATDPNPVTQENEALTLYFQRLQVANERFAEEPEPGWRTERGEVYIKLGEPDEIARSSPDYQGRGFTTSRWSYYAQRLSIELVDEMRIGVFRMTSASRSEYRAALRRKRKER